MPESALRQPWVTLGVGLFALVLPTRKPTVFGRVFVPSWVVVKMSFLGFL